MLIWCHFVLRPTPQPGDGGCPTAVVLGHLALPVQEGGSCSEQSWFMSPQEDHVRQDSVIAFPWSPLHTCLSTASGDYLNGENILHTREMLKKRTVSQFAFICTSSHHHITGQFDGSDNLPYLRFISLHVDMKANFRHPIQTEKYATNYHIGLDLLKKNTKDKMFI